MARSPPMPTSAPPVPASRGGRPSDRPPAPFRSRRQASEQTSYASTMTIVPIMPKLGLPWTVQ